MVPSGPPTPIGGAQSVPSPSLLRASSGLLGGAQPNPIHSQQQFSSLVSPRTQFNTNNNNNNSMNMNILGNIPNVSTLINHNMGNGVNLQQLGSAELDPLSSMNQLSSESHSQPQQLEPVQSFQRQQQQIRGLTTVKLEPQMGSSDHNNGPMRSIGGVKMEPQQLHPMRSLGPVKLEQQHSDSSIFLQQQQHQQQQHQQHQQQQLLQMSRPSPHAAVQLNLLQQQQRVLQQQQLLKGLPPRGQLQQQQQIQQNVPMRSQLKPNNYEPGICARRLTQYMYHQQHKPEDNNIEFWRKFVAEYFAPNAKKRWCVSLYGSGRQTTGVFPQDVWHCEICNRKPGRGFETTAEVLPRLCQIKYASGTIEELLYVDMPSESHNAMGQIVLDYPKAIQESVFEQLRVVRDGHLRIVFNPDLKISSWEFCARKHEELIPRRVIIPQVSQLGAVVQKYQTAVQNSSSGLSTQDMQNSCNSFVASARQLAKALEVPLVNDLGYTKRYVRCLQISEVVNSMKDLIDYSRETRTGPMDSLINFPRRNSNPGGLHPQHQPQQPNNPLHQTVAHNSNPMQLASCTNGIMSVNNSNGPSSSCQSLSPLATLHHQNSMNSRQQDNNQIAGPAQIPSTSSSTSLPQQQQNASSPFSPPTPSTSNNTTIANMPTPHEPDPNDSQSSVQRIIQGMMMSSSSQNGSGFGNLGGVGPSATVSGLRAAMANNGMGMNGVRVGMNQMINHSQQQQQQQMGGLGSVNSFNNIRFDWKPSP